MGLLRFLLYMVVRAILRLLGGSRDDESKDLELFVLRHQLRVLRRKAGRPRLTPVDRVLLAAASKVLPRDRWAAFLVTPQTLLRWHRELVRRKWTFRRRGKSGRPRIDAEVRDLIYGGDGLSPESAPRSSPKIEAAAWSEACTQCP